jgi:hypothetical protein
MTQDLHRNYEKMYKMRTASFRKFCQESFEEIVWTEPADNSDTCTEANWNEIKKLWHSEPCNVFWAGADTFMIRPTSLFGDRFKEYRLFNYTDPRGIADIPHYFNDDVRYYPAKMDPEVWNVGERLMRQWYDHAEVKWDLGQMIHNYQYWSQPMAADTVFDPRFNWLAHGIRAITPENIAQHEEWNRCSLNQAKIVHFSGSRGGEAAVKIMRDFVNYLNLDI